MSKKKKTKGKDFKANLRGFHASYYGLTVEKDSFNELITSEDEEFMDILRHAPPHASYYEWPFDKLLATFFYAFGLTDLVIEFSERSDPNEAILEYLKTDPEIELSDEELTVERAGLCASILFALNGCIESFQMHSLPLPILVYRAGQGDDEALFDAVMVDRSVVGAPTINKRIQLAQLQSDESFFDRLAKATTRTRPRRPSPGLDDVRFMLEYADEEFGLDTLTTNELHDSLVNDLELYPSSTTDQHEALRKLIQTRNKKVKEVK